MGADYRDELSAAHSRIAELEEKVRALELEQQTPKVDLLVGRFPELEASVARLRRAADGLAFARRMNIVQFSALPFILCSSVFSLLHLPIMAMVTSIVFLGSMVSIFVLRARFKASKRALVEAEQKLADAHRMRDLETKLAETQDAARVRIGSRPKESLPGGGDLEREEPVESEQAAARRA